MAPKQKTATISIVDYAVVSHFAQLRGANITELEVDSLVVVDTSYHKAITQFRALAKDFDAVLNIQEFESRMPTEENGKRTYHIIRGTGVCVTTHNSKKGKGRGRGPQKK